MFARKHISKVDIAITIGVILLLCGATIVLWKTFIQPAPADAGSTAQLPKNQSAEVLTTKADLDAAAKKLDSIDFNDESSLQAAEQAEL